MQLNIIVVLVLVNRDVTLSPSLVPRPHKDIFLFLVLQVTWLVYSLCVLLRAGECDFLDWPDPTTPSLPVWSQWMCEGATGGRGTSGYTHTTARVRSSTLHTLQSPSRTSLESIFACMHVRLCIYVHACMYAVYYLILSMLTASICKKPGL